jgi:O-antigen/teichoic acid export membrane protein
VIPRLRALLRNPTLVYFGAITLSRAASFFLIPLYTRRLTPAEYGDYALGQTILGTLPVVMTLSLQSGISRFFFESSDVHVGRTQAGSIARWHLLFAAASVSAVEALVHAAWPEGMFVTRHELECIILACGGSAALMVPSIYMRVLQRPWVVASFQFGEFACVVASGLFFVRSLGRGLAGAFEASATAYGFLGLVAAAFILALPGRLDAAILRRALGFTLPLVPHLLANQAQNIADRWTLEATGQSTQLGPYALAVQVTSPSSMLVAAYNDAASPRMGEALRSGGMLGVERTIRGVRLRYLLVGAFGAALVMLAIPVARLLVGPKFQEALWLAPFLALVLLVEALYFPNLNVIYFASETKRIPPITFSAAAINVGLNVVFIHYAGVAGAIAARAVSMTYRTTAVWLAARGCFRRAEVAAELVPREVLE